MGGVISHASFMNITVHTCKADDLSYRSAPKRGVIYITSELLRLVTSGIYTHTHT